MSNLRVGVDVDGVLANFNKAYRTLLIQAGSPVPIPEVTDYFPNTWSWEKALGISKEIENKAWQEINSSRFFWESLEAYQDTFPFLHNLEKLELGGADVYFITNRSGNRPKNQTEWWLRTNGYSSPTVIISKEKGLCAKALRLTHYLDDKTENYNACATESPETKTFRLLKPWNSTPEKDSVISINSVGDFLKILQEDRIK